jgi:ketosteroid isomerase-like protein
MKQPSDGIVRTYVETVQAARRTQAEDEAWRRVADLLAENVRWRFAGGGADRLWPVELIGRDAVLRQLRSPMTSWSRLRTETVGLLGCGPVVLVEQVSTIVADSGLEKVKPVAHVFSVIEGLISEIRTYRNDAHHPGSGEY